MTTVHYDPDNWVTTLFRSLKNYVEANLDLDIYDVRFEWPDTSKFSAETPLAKTIIHFDLDDESNPVIGFGDSVIDAVTNVVDGTVTEREGACHVLNFDVGVWASVETGGPTSRMEARYELGRILQGPSARAACSAATDGVEIMSFSGGTFLIDTINDLTIWRITSMELVVRVYSRKTLAPATLVDTITQDQVVQIVDETPEEGGVQDIVLITQNPDLIVP